MILFAQMPVKSSINISWLKSYCAVDHVLSITLAVENDTTASLVKVFLEMYHLDLGLGC